MQQKPTISKRDFRRLRDFVWELPHDYDPGMKVPVHVYADDRLLEKATTDQSLRQAVNVASLPGVVEHVVIMPDVHQGYGMPIGGVMASDARSGIVSPGAVGYDINCGVRLLASNLSRGQVQARLGNLARSLYDNCPSGVGSKGRLRLTESELDDVLQTGSAWARENGYATGEDLQRTEEGGCIPGAEAEAISNRSRSRGQPQLGTLGAGNHFIEVDEVVEVHHEEAARLLGLEVGQVVVQIHCGSRGLGHQVCTDFVSEFQGSVRKFGLRLPDRELVCAPIDSPEGQRYLGAMAAAANFAFANRQVLAHFVRESFEQVFPEATPELHQIYDIAHNMAKLEEHGPAGKTRKLCVHRKGATRAFGPGAVDLPPDLRHLGQPVLIPGSMGTASWVLIGTQGAMQDTFGSTCHGAGRVMSRSRAKKSIRGEPLRNELRQKGIFVQAGSMAGLAEEAPTAYKDVDRVVDVVSRAGIADKVARLVPMAVVKG